MPYDWEQLLSAEHPTHSTGESLETNPWPCTHPPPLWHIVGRLEVSWGQHTCRALCYLAGLVGHDKYHVVTGTI